MLNPGRTATPCRSHSGYLIGTVGIPADNFAPTPAIVVPAGPKSVASTGGPTPNGLCLRWGSGAPVSSNGAYLSARFPTLWAIDTGTSPGGPYYNFTSDFKSFGDFATKSVRRTLELQGGDTSDFSIQTEPQPTSTTGSSPASWTWVTRASPGPIAVAALDTSALQEENNKAFLSGILLGVAGGALIALVTELVMPIYRKEKDA